MQERRCRHIKNKTAWLLTMVALCLVLYTVIASRLDKTTSVIFGGVEGAYVQSDSVTFADPNATEAPDEDDDIWPKISPDDLIEKRQYVMVNNDNPLSSASIPEDLELVPGTKYQQFSAEAMPYLTAMLEDCRAAGHTVMVVTAYRSYSYQNELFNRKASSIAEGMGIYDYLDPEYQKAAEEARKITAFPGCSEHQLGLAVDLMDKMYSTLIYGNMDQELFAWLDEHCAEYGFIKRYPTKKLLLTGWDEPWHYRYVGVEAATFIMENDLCYEEFYAHYNPDFEY